MHGLVAGLGSILQIRPILRMYHGSPSSERARTRGKGMERLTCILEEIAPLQRAAIVHADAEERARDLREQTRHLLPAGDVPLIEIAPSSAHALGRVWSGLPACKPARGDPP
jgi:fatty acid-binding protein DegV